MTAHPTEATRRTILSLQARVADLLLDAERGDESLAATVVERVAEVNTEVLGEGSPVERIHHAMARMRGNRSSSLVTWYDDKDRMHLLQWKPPPRRSG